jgi:ABC-type amino acid transport substrate-binding protein
MQYVYGILIKLGGKRMKIFKKLTSLSLVLASIALIISCSFVNASSKVEGRTLAEIKKSGKIIIGTNAGYPPFEYHDKKTNEVIGFDMDLAQRIAKDLKVKVEIKDMQFDGLIVALKAGAVDVVIAGMNPTPKRGKSVNFSKVYYDAKQVLVVKSSNINKFKTIVDLKGKKLAAQKGTTCADTAKTIKGTTLTELPKVVDEVIQLKAGLVDAFIADEPVAKLVVKANKGIAINKKVTLQSGNNGFAVAMSKGKPDLLKAINNTITSMDKDGSIEGLVSKYFK